MNNQQLAARASRFQVLQQLEVVEAAASNMRTRAQSAQTTTQRTRQLQPIEDVAGEESIAGQSALTNPQLSIGYPNNQLPYPNNQLTYPDNQIADAPQTYGPLRLRRQPQPYSLGRQPSQRSNPYGLSGGSPIDVFVKTLTGDPYLLTQLSYYY